MHKLKILILSIFANGMVNAQELTVELPVSSHEAIYETVFEKVPYEHCWEEKIPVRKASSVNPTGAILGGLLGSQIGKGRGKDAAMIVGTLLGSGPRTKDEFFGGVLGGVAGKQFGKGKGKDAAIVAGTILGSSMSSDRNHLDIYRKEQRCETRYREIKKKVLSGYIHTVEFMGRKFEQFYSQKKETVNLNLSLNFEADQQYRQVRTHTPAAQKVHWHDKGRKRHGHKNRVAHWKSH